MKIIIISDTHRFHDLLIIPDGDILIHCGDFCSRGTVQEAEDFNRWLGELPHRHKILIAGNHDICMEDIGLSGGQALMSNSTYLLDSFVEICGIKIWGSPWQPEFCDLAFNLPRGMLLKEKWGSIPDDADIVVTHGPPNGVLDICPDIYDRSRGINVGCESLAKRITEIKPKIHCFGHIHEGYGIEYFEDTYYVNASICTGQYKPSNKPHIINI